MRSSIKSLKEYIYDAYKDSCLNHTKKIRTTLKISHILHIL